MTQKKQKGEIPADMWLHVATDALARYAAGGGLVEVVVTEAGVMIILAGIAGDDHRLSPAFVDRLLAPAEAAP